MSPIPPIIEEMDTEEQILADSFTQTWDAQYKEIMAAPRNPESYSVSTTADLEDRIEGARQNNPNGLLKDDTGVSVEQAEANFAELQRELSGLSRASCRNETDLERGRNVADSRTSEDEFFDLEGYLRGGLTAVQEVGIRPKHVGVSWEALTVKGMGGSTNFVKTFPDVIVEFFNIVSPITRMLGLRKKGTEVMLLDQFRGVCKPGELVLVLGVSRGFPFRSLHRMVNLGRTTEILSAFLVGTDFNNCRNRDLDAQHS